MFNFSSFFGKGFFVVSGNGLEASPEAEFRAKLLDFCASCNAQEGRLDDLSRDLDGLINDPDVSAGAVIKYLLNQSRQAGLWNQDVTPLSALRAARRQGTLPPQNAKALGALEQRIRDARRKPRAAQSGKTGKTASTAPQAAPAAPQAPDMGALRRARLDGICAACAALEALIGVYQGRNPRRKSIPLQDIERHLRRLAKAARR